MSRLNRLRTLGGLRGRALSGAVAASDLLSQIQTPTLAWGDIKTGATPWYSDAGTTPAVPTDGVYRLTEHISGSQYCEQTTAGARPTLTDGTPYDYLLFDGGDGMQSANNFGTTGDTALEVVLVVSFTNASDSLEFLLALGTDDLAQAFTVGRQNASSNIFVGINGTGANADVVFNSAVPDTNLHVYRVVKATGARPRLFVDGTEKSISSGGTWTATNLAANKINFGQSQQGATFQHRGKISAAMLYAAPLASDALRAADDATIKTYFGIA